MKIKFWQIGVLGLMIGAGWMGWSKWHVHAQKDETIKIISPQRGDIKVTVSATGTVLPKNRLQVKPPVNGRIEQILVQEGQKIKIGDILVWMSSTDRAALLDAARGQGDAIRKDWEDVYKPIPLMSPIDGEVIVGTIQPGQTVTTSDDVLVLSDRLIVRGQVDETDIGKIEKGLQALIRLDAYPDIEIKAVVDHIYYESKTINNVTIYEVDLKPETIPAFFRSGMNANIEFITVSKEDVLLLPQSAIQRSDDGDTVIVNVAKSENSVRLVRKVELGLSDDKNVEILSGLTEKEEVVLSTKKFSLEKSRSGSSPFMPSRRKKN